MINKSKLLYILSFMVAMFIGCEDTADDPAADTTLETPTSVSYTHLTLPTKRIV